MNNNKNVNSNNYIKNINNELNCNKINNEKKFYTVQEINNIKTSFNDESSFYEKNKSNQDSQSDELKKDIMSLKQEIEKNKKEKSNFIEFLQL